MAENTHHKLTKALFAQTVTNLRPRLRRYLQSRLASRLELHDEIESEAILRLWQRLSDASEEYLIKSASEPLSLDENRLFATAITIVRNLIADQFRSKARIWSATIDTDQLGREVPEDNYDIEVRQDAVDILRLCLAELSNMSQDDIELIRHISGAGGQLGPNYKLTDADRKRLSRLRHRLKESIWKQKKIDIDGFFS